MAKLKAGSPKRCQDASRFSTAFALSALLLRGDSILASSHNVVTDSRSRSGLCRCLKGVQIGHIPICSVPTAFAIRINLNWKIMAILISAITCVRVNSCAGEIGAEAMPRVLVAYLETVVNIGPNPIQEIQASLSRLTAPRKRSRGA